MTAGDGLGSELERFDQASSDRGGFGVLSVAAGRRIREVILG
jgi:hypothetical protein